MPRAGFAAARRDPTAARGRRAPPPPRARAPSRRPCRVGCRRRPAPAPGPRPRPPPPAARRSSPTHRRAAARRGSRRRSPPRRARTQAPHPRSSAHPSRPPAGPPPSASASTSRHVTVCDTHENASAGVTPPWPSETTSISGGIVNPVRKSRSRRPSTGVSTVSTSAVNPWSTACRTSSRVTPSSRNT